MRNSEAFPFSRLALRIEGLAVFFATFLVYLANLFPAVAPRDGIEIATYAPRLLPLHQPGYPLYVIAVKLFSAVIRAGNDAYRANLFSAFCCALSLALLHQTTRLVIRHTRLDAGFSDRLAGLACGLAALLVGLSPLYYSQAIQAEVFGFNVLIYALLWQRVAALCFESSRSNLLLLAGVLGLSASHHQTIVFVFPALLLPLYARRNQLTFRAGEWGGALLACLIGFAVYFSLIPMSGGSFVELASWRNLLGDFFRLRHGTFSLAREGVFEQAAALPAVNYLTWLKALSVQLWNGLSPLGTIFLVAGFTISGAWALPLTLSQILAFLMSGPVFLLMVRSLAVSPENLATIERFMQLPSAALVLIIAIGAIRMVRFSCRFMNPRLAISMIILATLPFVGRNIREFGRRDCFIAEDFAENLWRSAKNDATIVLGGGSSPLAYQYAKMKAKERLVVTMEAFSFDPPRTGGELEYWGSMASKLSRRRAPLASTSLFFKYGVPPNIHVSLRGLLIGLSPAPGNRFQGGRAPIESLYSFRGRGDRRFLRDPYLAGLLGQYAPLAALNSSAAQEAGALDAAERDCQAILTFVRNDYGHALAGRCMESVRRRRLLL